MKVWFEVIAEHENWRDLVDVFETLEDAKNVSRITKTPSGGLVVPIISNFL